MLLKEEEKKMSNWKKLAAIMLAAIMILSTSVSALADGAATANDEAVETDNEVVRIVKEITVYNPDSVSVNEPTASYTYTITAGSADKTIKDADGIQAATKAGVTAGIKISSETTPTAAEETSVTLTYGPTAGTFSATSGGTANTKWIDIDFSGVNFGQAGVYRYVITESGYTYDSNGVVEGSTGHVRYLDVYVKDAETQSDLLDQPSDWAVYGYALFTANEDIDAKTDPKETKKTTGFVTHTDGEEPVTADQYYTFNLEVSKTVLNDAYTKNTHHEFPFTLTLTNGTVTDDVLPIMTLSENATQDALSAVAIAGTWEPTIADGARVSYVGIPAGTTIDIKEKNDVVGVTYKVTVTGADTNPDVGNVYYNEEFGTAVVSSGATAGQAATANRAVNFENDLQQISPTGVILRVAPYVLMLAVGVVLLVIARRKRATR